MSIDREKLRAKLEALKAELGSPVDTSEADRTPVELDQTSVGRLSRMDAIQVQAMALATEERRKAELARVRSALERIDSDEFGYCDVCGEEIAPARLEQPGRHKLHRLRELNGWRAQPMTASAAL